ncbi:MAG: hypothetical protein AMXMBFR23_02940 [Chloroflexota bacterium]
MRRGRTVGSVLVWVAAAILIAACGGGSSEPPTATPLPATASPTASPTAASPTQTATPSIEEAVAEAYLAYWEAYAQAVLNLDLSLVEDFVTDEELERVRGQIEALRTDGVAARLVIEHDFAVVSASETSAVVIDEFVNNSFLVDAETKEPPEAEGLGEVYRDTFFLEKVDGRWLVVRTTSEPQ